MKQIARLNNIIKLPNKDVEFHFNNYCVITILAEYTKWYVNELSKTNVGVFKSENGAIWIGQRSDYEYNDMVVFTLDLSVIYPYPENKWSISGSIKLCL
jgi:hypothetical protein